MSETKRVKITQKSFFPYWYNDYVGHEFDLAEVQHDERKYTIDFGDLYKAGKFSTQFGYVNKSDAELINKISCK